MRPQTNSNEQIETLQQGEIAWNRRRQECPDEAAPDFSGNQFAYANFSGFDLHGVVLQRAYLRGASLRRACLRQADLQGAYLIDADLEQAELAQARLVATNLNGANLVECSFQGANLREADCGGAQLTRADFTDADLHGVNLLGADLEGARFVRTRGVTSRQIMAARNWDKALYDPELSGRLDLPLAREAGAAVPAPQPAPLEDSEQPHPAAEPSEQPVQAFSCSLDPTLG